MFFGGFLRGNIHPGGSGVSCEAVVLSGDESVTIDEYEEYTMYAGVLAGTAPITYQWQEKPFLGDFSDINGATGPSYTTPNTLVQGDSPREYKCNAANDCGFDSRTYTLTIMPGGGGSGGMGP